jgi:hypothetical protein
MASSYTYFDQQRPYSPPQQFSYAFPPVESLHNHLANSISPWSSSSNSQNFDSDSLTLPPLLGSFDDNGFALSTSQSAPVSEQTLFQNPYDSFPLQSQVDASEDSDFVNAFFNWDDDRLMPSTRSPASRSSSVVDLTASSPAAMPPSRKRKTPSTGRAQSSSKKAKLDNPIPSSSPDPETKEVDLSGIDNDEQLEDFQRKQQAELIRQQNQEKADKPVKLADFQCIICLDNPTDLTVTHCGK